MQLAQSENQVLKVYDVDTNQFTLEMYRVNQEVIKDFAKSTEAVPNFQTLVFDIAQILLLIEEDEDTEKIDTEKNDTETAESDQLYTQNALNDMCNQFKAIRDSSWTSQLLSRFFNLCSVIEYYMYVDTADVIRIEKETVIETEKMKKQETSLKLKRS
ncbi:hypothetical protein GEMRC1_002319 [Eukaryota sp. GEM-RC1]